MDSIFIWAQIVGLFAMIIGVAAMQLKNPRYILLANIPSSLLWTAQYMMLGAPLGAIMNSGSAIKDGAVALVHQRYVSSLIYLYLLSTWSIGLYSFSHWYDLLPIIGCSAVNIALLINRDNRGLYVRSVIINSALWIIYNSIVGSWMGATCAVFIIGSSIISMARYEGWKIGKCHKTFAPSLMRSLFALPNFRTYP